MSADKWMSKLTKDLGKIASDIPEPSKHIVKLPSPSLNWITGTRGIPRGKTILMAGPESGGKSLLGQLTLIQLQKDFPEGICILFDAEYSFNPTWFEKLGGDLKRLIIRQSNDPLDIFDYIEEDMQEMLQDGAPIVGIMIDSIKAIRYPKDRKDKTTKIVMAGGGSSYLGPALKGIIPVIRQFNITTIMVQQVYEELDQYKAMQNPFVIPDGRSLKHATDLLLMVQRVDTKVGRVEDGKNIHGGAMQVGHVMRVKCRKNRVGAPYRTAQLTLEYNKGITNIGQEIYDLAKSLSVIYHPINPDTGKPSSQMWKFGDYDAVRGESQMIENVKNNPKMQEDIMEAVYSIDDEKAIQQRNKELGLDTEGNNLPTNDTGKIDMYDPKLDDALRDMVK